MTQRHTIDTLLEAYEQLVGDPPYGLDEFRPWFQHRVDVLCGAFGVSLDEADVPAEKRDVLAWMKRALKTAAELPYPTKGALEAGLVYQQCLDEFLELFARLRALHAFYRGVARELANELWGELGERSDRDLARAGLEAWREPIVDYDAL